MNFWEYHNHTYIFLSNSLASCVVKTTGELNSLDPTPLAAATLHVYASNSSSSDSVCEVALLLRLTDNAGRLNRDSVHSTVFDSKSVGSTFPGAIQDKVAVVVPVLMICTLLGGSGTNNKETSTITTSVYFHT